MEDSPDAPLKPPGEPGGPVPEKDLPRPRVERARRWNVSLVWLVPAVAIAIAASMLVRTVFLAGPRIEIQFKSADGVEAGKTEVRYKEVVIGKVLAVNLRDDRKSVAVIVQLDRSAASFAVEDTAFWVVRPRIGTAGVSGLGTLARAHPEPGLLAFAAVVVLTLFAARSFDPRLIWRDASSHAHA